MVKKRGPSIQLLGLERAAPAPIIIVIVPLAPFGRRVGAEDDADGLGALVLLCRVCFFFAPRSSVSFVFMLFVSSDHKGSYVIFEWR